MLMPRTLVDYYKNSNPPGTRIMLDEMNDDPNPVPPGTTGTVKFVDDAGTLHTDFDNGRKLGVCPEVDSFHIIEPAEDSAETETPSITMLPAVFFMKGID